jgi:hypothetical protein
VRSLLRIKRLTDALDGAENTHNVSEMKDCMWAANDGCGSGEQEEDWVGHRLCHWGGHRFVRCISFLGITLSAFRFGPTAVTVLWWTYRSFVVGLG